MSSAGMATWVLHVGFAEDFCDLEAAGKYMQMPKQKARAQTWNAIMQDFRTIDTVPQCILDAVGQ